MISGEAFVDELLGQGYRFFSGVPCSYLTPFINTVIDSEVVEYIGAANEGDAVAAACGAELGGKPSVVLFQNSGLGNAVNPLTSLTDTFRIPVLILTTWRGEPERVQDEPQHDVMGKITPDLLQLMGIPWERFPDSMSELTRLLQRAKEHMRSTGTPFAIVVSKGTISGDATPRALERQAPNTARMIPGTLAKPLDSDEVLQTVRSSAAPGDALLATTGFTGRALYALGDHDSQFYMVGSMGCVSSLGLGLALAQPQRRILVLDGDGALLMRMGAVATIGHAAPDNLVHILLDNGAHDSTGSQSTVAPGIDLAAVAQACGYAHVARVDSLSELEKHLKRGRRQLTFLHLCTAPRSRRKLPRPTITPPQVAERFRKWLAQA
ncbi:MAG: phosphonopyruvate decarboxylase [Planctomycetota bacterium]